MLRWPAAAIAAVLLAGCASDEAPSARTDGDAAATATQTATAPARTPTTGQTSTSADGPSRAGRPGRLAVDSVRECLSQHGYRGTRALRAPGTRGAPNSEILVAAAGGTALIAFYDTLANARRYEARLRKTAGRLKGARVERQGTVTIAWIELTDATARTRIRDCVRQES